MRPIAVDLFAGAGGMSLGFEQAGFDILAAVEHDPVHCATHEYNFPDCAIICKSVTTTTGLEIRENSDIGNADIDVVFGGPPCQGVSLMGKRALDDPRNELMLHFVRLVAELNPKYFVMENVKGLTIGKHKGILTEVITQLQASGYEVEADYKVLNAAEYGVPQDRRRLFLFGCRRGFQLPKYPLPVTRSAVPSNQLKLNGMELPVGPTVWDAIQDLPEAENYPQLLDRDWVTAPHGKPSNYAAPLRWQTDPQNYSYERLYHPELLTSSMRTVHTNLSIDRFSAAPPGTIEPISRFPKLSPTGICNTLRAGTGADRGAYTSPRPIHPTTPRCITVREAARLHSYPDWFRFHFTKWHGFRQIGNSVPPNLARAVGSSIISALNIQPQKPMGIVLPGDLKLLGFTLSEAANYYGTDRKAMGSRTRISNNPNKLQSKLQELDSTGPTLNAQKFSNDNLIPIMAIA